MNLLTLPASIKVSNLNENAESQLSRQQSYSKYPSSIHNSILNITEPMDTKPEVMEKQSGKFAVFVMRPKKQIEVLKLPKRKTNRKSTFRAGSS